MDRAPLISVVMAVFNGERYLRESIDSILKQTCPDFEIIIINDGSTDQTPNILDGYSRADNRVKVIQQKNKGLAESLNIGIQMARGKFIARMDADDIALPNRLEKQCGVLLNDRRIGLCHSLFGLIDADGQPIFLRQRAGFRFSSLQTRWTLIWRNCICHPSVMMRRSLLVKHNLFYDGSVVCQDYDLWCRLIEKTDFQAILEPLLLLRKHSDSVSANYDENYLAQFSGVILQNLKKYVDTALDQSELRAITLISGQMYIRGRAIRCQIDERMILRLLDAVTSRFVELHHLNKKAKAGIQIAAARQLFRWAQQSRYHNQRSALKFTLAGLSRLFSFAFHR